MNVFRTATGQAVRDIISEHATTHRFGLSLTDADLDAICERVVDLFEMTLNLRAQVGTGQAPQTNTGAAPQSGASTAHQATFVRQEPTMSLTLPRTRVAVAQDEKETLMRRRPPASLSADPRRAP